MYICLLNLKIMMYTIKDKDGFFVSRDNDDSKKLFYGDLDHNRLLSKSEVGVIQERFKGTWRRREFKVYEVNLTLTEASL
jgi:hypothetical protein